MPDVYATITDADPAVVARIAEVLELRAADPQQVAMRRTYLADIGFPPDARVLDVGCGTGAITRELARWPGVAEVTGIDLSPTFLARARALDPPANVRFVEGDARTLPIADNSVDAVVFHTTLCHVPAPRPPCARPSGCCGHRAGSPSSTATTPRPRWRQPQRSTAGVRPGVGRCQRS